MKKSKIPELCQTCTNYQKDNLFCNGYALRCAVNNFKKAFTDVMDAFFNCKTEYDYDCDNYEPIIPSAEIIFPEELSREIIKQQNIKIKADTNDLRKAVKK